jgi:hypothetical protein
MHYGIEIALQPYSITDLHVVVISPPSYYDVNPRHYLHVVDDLLEEAAQRRALPARKTPSDICKTFHCMAPQTLRPVFTLELCLIDATVIYCGPICLWPVL